jgi:hypothetical protein
MVPTANFSVTTLEEVFGKHLITCGLWRHKSPDLNLCDFYMWATLKDRIYVKNPHSLQELKDNI